MKKILSAFNSGSAVLVFVVVAADARIFAASDPAGLFRLRMNLAHVLY
jgi:hypothetical protein